MKLLWHLTIFNILFLGITSYGQDIKIKEGAYRNIVDFHKNEPFIENIRFMINPTKNEGIYKVRSDSRKINSEVLSFNSWVIYQDSTLFVNLQRLGMGNGFAKILELGRYSLFIGRLAATADQKQRLYKNSFYFGLVGLAASSYIIGNELSDNTIYLLDLKNGMPENLDMKQMQLILRDHEDLYNQYMMENEKESPEIMVEYLRQLNERLPLY